MHENMRLLIGYDGSERADRALADLRLAGLPRKAEAFSVSVADVLIPPHIDQIAIEYSGRD